MLNISANDKIENQPIVVRQISKKLSQNNKEYYSLQISFGIKNFDAKIWNGDPEISKNITPGCFAYISGIARDFKGTIQIHINQIKKIENPDQDLISQVMPCSQFDESKLVDEINSIIDTVSDPMMNMLLKNIFSLNFIKENFYKKAAGAEIHHAYVGGLAQHTIEVSKLVSCFCSTFPYINRDVAITASLLHDIGKTIELSNFPENKYTDKGKLLGHIALGVKILDDSIAQIEGFPDAVKLQLEHCILSHHGSYEAGSPVLPMTVEAIALHNADKTSADLNGFHLAIERDSGSDLWTDYIPAYKRCIKIPNNK